ncbi:efflux transporter RND family, MFP subunit [Thermosipho africanus Ob7]|uniref:Efflux transporter, RND family, MFP subunit n=1 Tax=Thermosipho africanus (strain TCF52B) TaxID=484019 RepID=B7IFR2_THEAB|nr:HlyD family efflux transporter periplasmic adaptor subunit [Thermosipho africanus]ACJ74926.1 efflux transporter, RND family, MFP subunit [Thermosipho africanus TCF52B]MDK2839147.1 hypothetical protein [Thermosipho sp. (in: thermotogales)]MDK2899875.1 hypothetical protein [Thermosipho sp. (in: thermotogales)]RDI92566.1 efflux transporter RND family, MFP subunit [Thermosipho africanus Ob7]
MKKKAFILSLMILILLISSCGLNSNKDNVALVKSIEYTVKKSDLVESVSATGKIIPKNYMTIYPEVSGKVVEVYVNEGDFVKKGDPILKIDDEDYKISYLNAKLSYEMVKGNGTLEEELKRLQYEKAYDDFVNTVIKAPISGYIVNFSKKVGDLVNQNQALCVILDRSNFEFEGTIDIIDYSKVQVGQKISIEVEGNSEILQGEITYKQIANISSANVTTATIRADINKVKFPENIFIGASCEGEILTINKKDVLKVPTNAVIVKNGKRYVQVKTGEDENNNPISELREIKIGAITEDFVEVVSGLNEGDVVLIQNKSLSKNLSKAGNAAPPPLVRPGK